MKNGYDQFFKTARKTADSSSGGTRVKFQKDEVAPRLKLGLSSEDLLEAQMRRRAGVKQKKKKNPFPWRLAGMSFVGLIVALWGFQNYEKVESLVKNIEISLLGSAMAEEAKPAPAAKPAAAPAAAEAKAGEAERSVASEGNKEYSQEELNHLTKLNDRKKELDAREQELARIEQELQAQKLDLEKRLKELTEMRGQISAVLEDRVKVDSEKVDTLVQMYSNMKAPQAAKIFESLDEDLAVEILGRMKKKNAAEIMNLLKPEKAQVFSERYAGYKRKQ